MEPFLRLVREASADDACISIKITLYRVAKRSHLCESLIMAAEAGREVTVLMGSFRPMRITPVDLFPQTFHVENVALLSKE